MKTHVFGSPSAGGPAILWIQECIAAADPATATADAAAAINRQSHVSDYRPALPSLYVDGRKIDQVRQGSEEHQGRLGDEKNAKSGIR